MSLWIAVKYLKYLVDYYDWLLRVIRFERINPLVAVRTEVYELPNVRFKIRRDHQKNFLWASYDQKEPILG